MKSLLRSASLALSLVALTGCPSTFPDPEPPPPNDPKGLFTVTSDLPGPVELDVRELGADVHASCPLLQQVYTRLDPARLDESLFDGPERLMAAPGDTVFNHTTRSRARLDAQPGCDVFRVARGDKIALYTPTSSYASTLTLDAQGINGSYVMKLSDGASQPEACEPRKASEVGYSEPVPVGAGLAVREVQTDGGCSTLSLGSAETGMRWRVCVGDEQLPVSVGDVIDVSMAAGAVRIDRMKSGELARVWLARAAVTQSAQVIVQSQVSGRTNEDQLQVTVAPDASCEIAYRDACGVTMPAVLTVVAGHRTFQIRGGEALGIGHGSSTTDVVVGSAKLGLLTTASCDEAARPRVEVAIIDRQARREASVAQ